MPQISKARILIAEDTATQAAQLKALLEKEGYDVIHASDGQEALEQVPQVMPDLIISDIVMPKMDGYTFCSSLKSNPLYKHIPIILLTSLAKVEDVVRGLESGADNFLTKPFEIPNLLMRVHFALNGMDLKEEDRQENLVELNFYGKSYSIKASKLQILNLLLSTFEAAVQRNFELNQAKTDLQLSNHRLSEANIQLKVVNDDLEKFTYSVSHDLRGPLRSIAGFLKIFIDEHSTNLSAEAKDCLARINAASLRMEQLIKGLLELSKMGRHHPQKQNVDLSQIVDQILDELIMLEPHRKVILQIEKNLVVQGDPYLLKAALENLIRNAWKFSSKKPETRISFGKKEDKHGWYFFIQDNGVGFDMKLAPKLFGAFQRLHRDEEFEGTGIGLATVHRIFQHHGGKIWVEAEPGVGATFYFRL